MGSFLPISATDRQNDHTDFAAAKLIYFWAVATASWLLDNYHRLCRKKTGKRLSFHLQRQYLSLKAARHTAAQRSRAHLHQPGADLDDPSLMKVAVFSSSLA